VFITPLVSLRTLDQEPAALPVFAEGVADAAAKARSKVAPELELGREHILLRVEPRMSYVSDEFASIDADFWKR
jgi:hypothetical protein